MYLERPLKSRWKRNRRDFSSIWKGKSKRKRGEREGISLWQQRDKCLFSLSRFLLHRIFLPSHFHFRTTFLHISSSFGEHIHCTPEGEWEMGREMEGWRDTFSNLSTTGAGLSAVTSSAIAFPTFNRFHSPINNWVPYLECFLHSGSLHENEKGISVSVDHLSSLFNQ